MEKLMKIICNWEFFHCHVWLPEGKNGSHSLLCDGVSKTHIRRPIPGTLGKCVTCQCHLEGPWILDFGIAYGYRGTDSESAGPLNHTIYWNLGGLWSFWGVSDFSSLFGSPRYVHRVCRMPHVGARGQSRCSRWASSEPARLDFERLVARNIPDFSPLLMEPYYSYMSYGQYSWLITINRG
jgi:hypothetical protein